MPSFRQQPLVFLPPQTGNTVVLIFGSVQVDFARQSAPCAFAIFTFMVTTLLTFIQITFPAATGILSFPFETHTKFMVANLSLLAFYCFAIAATQNLFPNHAAKLVTAIKCTASLLVASLVSLLLHKPWDQVPYITYVLYFTGHFLCLIINIILPYYRYVAHGPVLRSRSPRQELTNTPPLLPVTLSLPNISDHPNVNLGSITVVRTVH